MNLTIKMFLYEYLTVDQINQVNEGKLDLKELLQNIKVESPKDVKVYDKYLNLLAWVNKDASLVRTSLNQ